MRYQELKTDRLRLVNCDLTLIEIVLRGNSALEAATGFTVPADWTEFGAPIFEYTQLRLQEFPEDACWWTWLPILRAENLLVGSCGFKGRPNEIGEVEIGYEIANSRRNIGLGREAAMALCDFAFSDPKVHKVIAHTLAENNPSTKILQHCGMSHVSNLFDPEDGPLWRWEIDRATYSHDRSLR